MTYNLVNSVKIYDKRKRFIIISYIRPISPFVANRTMGP